MQTLNFQDAAFLRLESAERPFHVAGLMLFKLPDKAPANYLRHLADKFGRYSSQMPLFRKQLSEPDSLLHPAWVEAEQIDPASHVFHYALPRPGRIEDLFATVSRAHERQLIRSRPLWETHIIEGLPRRRFALYCKVHHALIDGVGALRLMQELFSCSPDEPLAPLPESTPAEPRLPVAPLRRGLAAGRMAFEQLRALPELSQLIASLAEYGVEGRRDAPKLPFSAPHCLFNTRVDAHRHIGSCEMSLRQVRKIARRFDGTVNDVLVAICGGALRRYLQDQGELPEKTLTAGLPVSVKPQRGRDGNQLTFIICPLGTDLADPRHRLQRMIAATRTAKQDLRQISSVAAMDFSNMILLPTLLLTLAGGATRVPPAINLIVSNVRGSNEPLYLEGARLERIYPLSIVTDAMGLNITVISYCGTLCFGITSCPAQQPGIAALPELLRQSYHELRAVA